MEMELIYKETMKPSSGTPPHLKTYPLSFLDVTTPPQYMPMIYFYHPKQIENQESKLALLKKSLPEALSMYYPIAGRFKGRLAIDCNDQGVPLLVTKLKCHLSHFLNNPIQPNLLPLFPDNLAWTNMNNPDHDPIMAIQINCFHCGGIAIAVCVTHKLGDISTLINFVNDWAAITNHYQHQNHPLPSPPLLDAGVSVFPQGDLPVYQERPYFCHPKSVCKRFVFEASKIEALKATAAPIHPTRFEAVTALICKCAASALGLSPNSPLLSSVAVNLRKRMDPPVPSKTLGNMITYFLFYASQTDQLSELVSKMKQRMVGCEMQSKKYGGKYRDLDFIGEILKRVSEAPRDLKFELMTLSSWCRFSTYEADFGWGKPVWIASVLNLKNGVLIMDARDGKGMEVFVSMEEQDMARLECNQDLLQYASVEPSVQLYHQDDLSTFNV